MASVKFQFIIDVLWVHALQSMFVVVHKKAKSRQAVSLYCYKVGSASKQDREVTHATSKKPSSSTLFLFKQANSPSN